MYAIRSYYAFKSGSKDKADFWIELGGKFIYIRYFPVRDANGHYSYNFV